MPAAANRRAGELPLEVLDSLESGVAVLVHEANVPAASSPVLFDSAHPAVASGVTDAGLRFTRARSRVSRSYFIVTTVLPMRLAS